MKEKASILIVQDELLAAIALQSNLERLGYRVYEPVATGEEAIESAEQEHPDVILMDIRLAGEIDGVQAAQEISARHGTRIILMTGYSDDETMERAKELQPVAYLTKPAPMYRIEAVIALALGG
jgi:CheY-like chemotaxis protein